MKLSKLLGGSAAVLAFSLPARAQQVTLNFDDLGNCTGNAITSYAGWLSIAAGATCRTGADNWWTAPHSVANYLKTGGNISWTFTGPVVFNGMYASGNGTFFLELLNGGNTVYSQNFTTYPWNVFVGNGYGGQVDQVRVTFQTGYASLGVDDISFTAPDAGASAPLTDLVQQPSANPEPATLLLVASGLGGVGAIVRRRRKAARKA